ncbi:MAG: type II toxin-antitoxin system RelE/ParE family toxin [Endomicrobium sp.]|jgi:putative addiction module killer protein|nr:type II toxin-antitoxin system RelE/ParE family toxin [Endomicrobium sp.]
MQNKITIKTTKVFDKWFNDLKDYEAVAAIRHRIENIKFGNFGDFRKVQGAKGIFELRLHLKSGYRIYYVYENNVVIILLNAGKKSTQDKDIEKAKILKECL